MISLFSPQVLQAFLWSGVLESPSGCRVQRLKVYALRLWRLMASGFPCLGFTGLGLGFGV